MGKSKGRKIKLTEEQKLLRIEEQRLREEELKRNKEELLAQYLKNKLEKEEKMASDNLNAIKTQWLEILRSTKSEQLKKELSILSQVFERSLDRKESIKEGLLKDIAEAEEQFIMAKRNHLQSVDKLINYQKKRLQKMNKDFKEQQDLLLDEFEVEKSFIVEQHKQEVFRLENIIYAMEETFLEKEAEARAEFQSNMDELKNRNLEDVHTLRLRQENLLEGLLGQFRNAMKVYQEATEERKKGFDELKEKDEKSTEEIEDQTLKIEKMQNDIKKEKTLKKSVTRDWDAKCKEIIHEKDVMAESFLCLKKKLDEVQAFEKERLTKLVLLTRDAITEMKEKLTKGENILKAAERCRKLESEHEKVLPFYQSSLTEAELRIINDFLTEEPKEPLTKLLNDFAYQENFWKRYNKVALENVALAKEKEKLIEVNKELRLQLKNHLSGLSNGGDLDVESSPMHINQKSLQDPVSKSQYSNNANQNSVKVADRNVLTKKQEKSKALFVQECSFAPRKILQ